MVIAPSFGGQLLGKGVDVENFPGVVGEQATGRGIVELMRRQAVSFGAEMLDDMLVAADLSRAGGKPLQLTVNGSSLVDPEAGPETPPPPPFTLEAQALIVATGADSRWLGVPGEYDLRGQGISSCATCDGFLFRDQPVVRALRRMLQRAASGPLLRRRLTRPAPHSW